jgi:Tol biopolymer transport system component
VADVREVFEMATKQIEPDQDAWKEQERRQRRAARNRKIGALAVAAALLAFVIAAFTVAQRSDRGTNPAETPSASLGVQLRAEIVGLDGAVSRTIPGVPADAYEMTAAPVGDLIAIVRYHDYTPQIATMTPEGIFGLHVLTHGLGAEEPAWSPDGSHIAFAGLLPNANHAIFVMDTDGRNVQQLTNGATDQDWPTWSPDGTQILFTDMGAHNGDFTRTQELWSVPVHGGSPSRLTRNHISDSMPSYSPDGTRIALYRGGYLWIMDADGSNAVAVGGARRWSFAPQWSPDGSRISFLTFAGHLDIPVRGAPAHAMTLEVLDVASGQITTLPQEVASAANRPTWVSNDELLVHALLERA